MHVDKTNTWRHLVPQSPERRVAKRGRPTNTNVAAVNAVIGYAVYQLSMWGYSLRGEHGIYRTIARSIASGSKRSIGQYRVEQIYKAWRASERKRGDWSAGNTGWPPLFDPRRFAVNSLRARRPHRGWSMARYAKLLLPRGGKWPRKRDLSFHCVRSNLNGPDGFPLPRISGRPGIADADLTPKARFGLNGGPQFGCEKRGS